MVPIPGDTATGAWRVQAPHLSTRLKKEQKYTLTALPDLHGFYGAIYLYVYISPLPSTCFTILTIIDCNCNIYRATEGELE